MDLFILFLQVVSIVAGVVLAFVLYQLIRLLLSWFRSVSTDEERSRFKILRMSDKAVGVLCAVCFLALVL